MSITSQNSVISILVDSLAAFPTSVQLVRFSTDDIYTAGRIRKNIQKMGVDGYQSSGKIWVSQPVTYRFQADSPSCKFFDAWAQAEDQLGDTLSASGLTIIPGIQTQWDMVNGSLGEVSPIAEAGQTLKERDFEIVWNNLIPSPYVGI